jgi:hypothetical protein
VPASAAHELYFPVNDEINGGHNCITAQSRIALIGQRDFSRTGRTSHAGNSYARAGLVRRTHAHSSNKTHLGGKLFHGRNLKNSPASERG